MPTLQKLACEILGAKAAAPLTVRSTAFAPNAPIPEQYSAYDKGISPPLSWSAPPPGTKSLVLMVEDPNATNPLPFVHWLALLHPNTRELPERASPPREGSNSRSEIGYFGPRPPAGDPPHLYHFQVFALDTMPDLQTGFTRTSLIESIRNHVLAKGELVGVFGRDACRS